MLSLFRSSLFTSRSPRRLGALMVGLALAVVAGGLALSPLLTPASAQSMSGTVTLEWFGWSYFRLTSPNGKVVLINPWADGNPDSSVSIDDVTKADLILVSDGHRDEVGNTIEIAGKTGARVWVPFELGTWFMEKGVPAAQVGRSNPGGRLMMDGITARMVSAHHGSGLPAPTAAVPYGGPAAGFVVTFENGWTVYFVGSAPATTDMAIWGELYKPDAIIYHMGSDHEPMDIARTIKLTMTGNPNLKTLIPHHHRVTPPAGAVSVAEVRTALDRDGVAVPITDPVRSQVYSFTK